MSIRLVCAAVLGLALSLNVASAPAFAAGKKTVAAQTKKEADVPAITVDQFKAMMKAKKKPRYLLIDVRTSDEFKAGHIKGAVLLPLDTLPQTYKRIPKGVTLVVACRSGRRSAEAVRFLLAHGYKKAINLDGGYQKWASCAGKARC